MKTYKNLYKKFCSIENLRLAHEKAKKGKRRKKSVVEFDDNLENELALLSEELLNQTYQPKPLRRFVIKDPKLRTIHSSAYRDRVVHHGLIKILGQIFEPRFISDSFASRKEKGTHNALTRFYFFKRKVSGNGRLVSRGGGRSNNAVEGYVLKADIQHYFENVDHE